MAHLGVSVSWGVGGGSQLGAGTWTVSARFAVLSEPARLSHEVRPAVGAELAATAAEVSRLLDDEAETP